MWMRPDWTRAGLATVSAFTLTAGGYWLLGAAPKDAQPPTFVINDPALAFDGCKVNLHFAPDTPDLNKIDAVSTSILPGPLPNFTVQASNLSDSPATVEFTAALRVSNTPEMSSRSAPPPPAPTWSQTYTLTLQPGQTVSMPIATGISINAMGMAQMSLETGTQKVTALVLSAQDAQPVQPLDVANADPHIEFANKPNFDFVQNKDFIWTIDPSINLLGTSATTPVPPDSTQFFALNGR